MKGSNVATKLLEKDSADLQTLLKKEDHIPESSNCVSKVVVSEL